MQHRRLIHRRLLRSLPAVALLLGFASVVQGCAAANYDPTTALGKQALLDSAQLQLNQSDCSGAVATLSPLFNSINTDNSVRMMMASAYGCAAGINIFKFIGDIAQTPTGIAPPGMWAFLATEFPSTTADDAAEGAQAGEDALASVIAPGTVVLLNEEFNTTTFNPGAYDPNSRLSNANAYLFFMSMAAIGTLENRDGSGNQLPWTSATAVDDDGCAYGSAIVNYADALAALAGTLPGSLGTSINSALSLVQQAVGDGCAAGCLLCGLGTSCPGTLIGGCPMTLRYRASCTGTATDPNSCAVAGLVTAVNSQW